MTTKNNDVDFVEAMDELLGLDKQAVESILDEIDADDLQELTDAVANQDRRRAQDIVGQFNTEDRTAPFRKHDGEIADVTKKIKRNRDGKMQFAIIDNVAITLRDKDGKTRDVSGTVVDPQGPEGTDTMIVKIGGKTKVVDKRDVHKIEEGILGMVGMPELIRMQKLAGIAAAPDATEAPAMGSLPSVDSVEIEEVPEREVPAQMTSAPMEQTLAALDSLEGTLPQITVADMKIVRQRLAALQTMLNESVGSTSFLASLGRVRKR